MKIIQKARDIVLADLRSCYREEGILASNVNFNDFWARDSFWASLGLIESEIDLDQVKKSLELFLRYQRKNGKIPRKIVLDYNGLKYLGIKIKREKPRPIYTSSIKWFFSMDDNLLLVMAFCKYVEKTNDFDFAQKYFGKIKRALEFYSTQGLLRDSLIYETGFGNWEDTIYKKGWVLYTNCLWYEAIKSFEMVLTLLRNVLRNNVSNKEFFLESFEQNRVSGEQNIPTKEVVLDQIQKKFWLEEVGYFADSVNKNQPDMHVDLAGNILAIIFEVADEEQAKKILDFVETRFIASSEIDKAVLHSLNYPRYPWYRISPVLYLLGIEDYQNGIAWSWIEALLIAAEIKNGRREEAERNLETLSNIITRNGHIHETYFLNGRTFDHRFWKSAVPFAWGAGLFLYAGARLEKSF